MREVNMSGKWLTPWVEARCRRCREGDHPESHREQPCLKCIKHSGEGRPGHGLATGLLPSLQLPTTDREKRLHSEPRVTVLVTLSPG